MTIRVGALFLLLSAASVSWSEVVLPAGTPLVASLPDHLPLKVGQEVDAELRYAVYVDNVMAVPAGTRLVGRVKALEPDHPHRLDARLRGDFTPFAKPVVQFERMVLKDGRSVALQVTPAREGAAIYRLVAPPPRKGGFVRQQIEVGKQMAKDRMAVVTGPDKRDRLVQFVYTQLPYHPQRIQKGTAWTVETTAPVEMADAGAGEQGPVAAGAVKAVSVEELSERPTWIVNAFLDEGLNSKTSKPGQAIRATVAEPIFNADHTVGVPQGAILEGAVTQVRPSRRFGRAGVLRFDFRQITFPSGERQNVQASLAEIDAEGDGDLAMNSEGKVKPKPQDKLAVPLILLALASRPLDRDHGDHQFGKDAVASNAVGLVGFIVGTTARAPNVAAGIGYYGTALSIYNRWIKRGAEIEFGKDTRVVVEMTARRSAVLKAQGK